MRKPISYISVGPIGIKTTIGIIYLQSVFSHEIVSGRIAHHEPTSSPKDFLRAEEKTFGEVEATEIVMELRERQLIAVVYVEHVEMLSVTLDEVGGRVERNLKMRRCTSAGRQVISIILTVMR